MTADRTPSKEPKSWTVLLIGELGNIFSFRVSKPLVVATGISVAALLALALLCTVHYLGTLREGARLKDDLATVKAELVAANKARETALVRLAFLETATEPDEEKGKPPAEQEQAAGAPQGEKPAPPDKKETAEAVTPAPKPVVESPSEQPAQPGEAIPPVSSERVAVEKLELWKEADAPLIKFQFVVKNTDPQGKRVKGYTFVVLTPAEGLEGPVAVSPPSPLRDGRPTTFEKGQYFSILRYKPVSGSFPGTARLERFKTAAVYVFSETGELLLENVFDMEDTQRSQRTPRSENTALR